MLNFNLLVLAGFSLTMILGFLIDVIKGGGGSDRIFTFILIISIFLSAILLLKGSYGLINNYFPQINKGLLTLLSLIFVVVQIFITFIITTLIILYVIAPIMIKLGFHVTMP